MTAPRTDQAALAIPDYAVVTRIDFQPQKMYQCGPAALAMALEACGVPAAADELSPQIYTPALKGSLQPGLVSAARRHGALAYRVKDMDCLLKTIASGWPVVVLQNLGLGWLPKWHYALVVGYDLQQKVLILHTGIKAYRHVSLRTFMNTWRRADKWGLVLLPPDHIPVCPRQEDWLKAALGLEQAARIKAARQAYETILTIWPGYPGALMGLGNTSYRLGDLSTASSAFERLIVLYPRNGDALNNLAQVLSELGQCNRALKYVRKAISIGGPHRQIYQLTLKELENGRCKDAWETGRGQSAD